jgi:hypothetical protein
MSANNNILTNRLAKDHEIDITVMGRKSGRSRSFPIWFVFESGTLYLLPVHGSDTQWYKNALRNPVIGIDARGAKAEVKLVPVTDQAQVALVVDKFRVKYGDSGVGLYSKLDVAVVGVPGVAS